VHLQIVDAFTNRPFAGNPAAVAVLDQFPDDDRMQLVAREMNLSETAFVVPRGDGAHDLRWFTPMTEVDLCGHATLASAHVLGGSATFHTRSGVLTCRPAGTWIEMDLPRWDPAPAPLAAFAGAPWTGSIGDFWLIELPSARDVRAFVADQAALAALGRQAVVLTAAGDEPGIDFVSRVFGPNVGIAEDPVTGSAHCGLAPYWSAKLGRDELVGFQASARGGVVRVRLTSRGVTVAGQAVTVAETNLLA
jgi:predicted PhzF superfamily epimerase YddE/YHI9